MNARASHIIQEGDDDCDWNENEGIQQDKQQTKEEY